MPEKTLQQVSRSCREQYEKGKAAFERNNLEYAVQILTAVLHQEPAFYVCREALRASQFKKAGSGGGFFKRMLGSASPKLAQARMALRSNPLEALHLAEGVLNHDPNNLGAHRVLAEAALAADLPRTAVLSLEIVFKQAAGDRDVAVRLSQALTKAGQPGRAEGIIAEFARAYPDDVEIGQLLKDISASRTLSEGGYDALAGGQGSYRDVLRDEQKTITLEQEQKEIKSVEATDRLIAEYRARVVAEPGNLRLLRALGELYAEKKDFDQALECYRKLTSSESPDPSVERLITETQTKKLDHALASLDPQAPDHAAQVERLKAQRHAFLLEDSRQRVDRYPTDLQLRFELGQLYFEAGRISEAIGEFQKAQNNPHKRLAALYCLGQCFAQRRMFDLAARTFENAIREKPVFDDEKKELLYALGCVLEQTDKKEEAVKQFKLIYEIDISYKDVAAKVDAYYAAQSG